MTRRALPLSLLLLASISTGWGCAGGEEEPEVAPLPELERVPTITVERPAFQFNYPETWRVDEEAPGHDPDRFFLLEGPDGATVAFMVLDEPVDPVELVGAMLADHGLVDEYEREFERWGRYGGYGRDVSGLNALGDPAGMRAFAYTSNAQSFLVAETYFEYSYAAARQGFDAVELSFALTGDQVWPAISLGTPVEDNGRPERLLVRPGFELHFPDDWRIDSAAPGYDPDAFFTLLTPYESSWMVVQLLDGELDASALRAEARLGLEAVLEVVDHEEAFDRWGELDGAGLELRGSDRDLGATLRVFAHVDGERGLLVTEFWYDELAPRVLPGFERVAETFAFRD